MLRITAVISCRNEAEYLKNLLKYLKDENISVFVINHESIDDTHEVINNPSYTNIIGQSTMKYHGFFDLHQQLEVKAEIIKRLDSDWIVHQDCDEILQCGNHWGGLRASIESADKQGFNVLNFTELVMLPLEHNKDDYLENNKLCYLFEPRPFRLMRCYKNNEGLSNLEQGGHKLSGGAIKVYPQRMILKHFIVKSQDHAYIKYLDRKFPKKDLDKNWHSNRVNFTKNNLSLPKKQSNLVLLDSTKSVPSPWPQPLDKHFWEW